MSDVKCGTCHYHIGRKCYRYPRPIFKKDGSWCGEYKQGP